jgi:enoyl-CoA hydratase
MIRQDRQGAGLVITIDRPDKANALTRDMLADLAQAFTNARDLPFVILTGNGKVFSAGADLDAARAGLAVDPVWEDLSAAIAACHGLTIAALNGTVAGGAMGMVLACDLRLAVPDARFFYPVMKLGFLPQPSDPSRLVQLVGPARAKMILMAGARIAAETALSWGLVDQLAEAEDLLPLAATLTADVAGADMAHVTAIKRMIRPA